MNSETEFYVLSALWNGYLKAITQVRGPTLILSSKDVQSMLELRSTAAKILGGETNDHRAYPATTSSKPTLQDYLAQNDRLVPRRNPSPAQPETQDGSDQSLGESERDHSTDGEAESDYEPTGGKQIKDLSTRELRLEWKYWNNKIANAKSWGAGLAAADEFRKECEREFKKRGYPIPAF